MANIFTRFINRVQKIFTPKKTITPPITPVTPSPPPKVKTVEEQTSTFYPPEERTPYVPQDDDFDSFMYDLEYDEEGEEVTEEEMAKHMMEQFFDRLRTYDRPHLADKYTNMWYSAIDSRGEYAVAKSISTYAGWGEMTEGLATESEGSARFQKHENELYAVLFTSAITLPESVEIADIAESEEPYD